MNHFCRHIASEIQCYTLFATHFHELTFLSDSICHVKNRYVVVDKSNDTVTLLYEVKDGKSDQSLGVHVAKLSMFPDKVVHLAKRKADHIEGKMKEKEWKSSGEDKKSGYRIIESFMKRAKIDRSEAIQHYSEVFKGNSFVQEVLTLL